MLDGLGAIPSRGAVRLPIYPSPYPNFAQNPCFPLIMKWESGLHLTSQATGISSVILTFNLNKRGIE